MSKICRICLVLVENEANSVNINTVEESTGFMPLRDKLALCVPEMVLDMIQDPVICTTCSQELQAAYEFKNKCLQTEEKIRRLIQCVGGVVYSLDLSKIANPSTAAKPPAIKAPPPVVQSPPPLVPTSAPLRQYPPAIITKVEKMEKVKKHADPVIVKKEPEAEVCEIEFQDVNDILREKPEDLSVTSDTPASDDPLVEIETEAVVEQKPALSKKPRGNIPYYRLPKLNDFGDIQCNFCEKAFPGLFYLRRHQRCCPQAISNNLERAESANAAAEEPVQIPGLKRRRKIGNNIVRSQTVPKPKDALKSKKNATRTTLPMKAKIILQKWLFQHREVMNYSMLVTFTDFLLFV